MVVGPRAALARSRVSARGQIYTPVSRVTAKLRYRSPAVPATVEATAAGFRLQLDEPAYGVARGQAAVLYDGESWSVPGGDFSRRGLGWSAAVVAFTYGDLAYLALAVFLVAVGLGVSWAFCAGRHVRPALVVDPGNGA